MALLDEDAHDWTIKKRGKDSRCLNPLENDKKNMQERLIRWEKELTHAE